MKLHVGFISLSILFAAVNSFASDTWNLNDVTYIFPLPNGKTIDASVRASDLDSTGQPVFSLKTLFTVSGANFDTGPDANRASHMLIPGDLLVRSPGFDAYQDLFLVAARIDPCFKDKFTDPCRRQIRAVWQPVDGWKIGNPQAADAAVHTFYDLSASEFEKLMNDLKSLKNAYQINTDGLALGIHPAFSQNSISPFQLDFKKLLLRNISSQKMSRMALVTLKGSSISWDLLSKDFVNGVQVPVKIFPNNKEDQGMVNIDGLKAFKNFTFSSEGDRSVVDAIQSRKLYTEKDRGFMGFSLSSPEQGDQLLSVAADSRTLLSSPEKAREILTRAGRVEDPSKNLPGTVDCVSCHIANAVKLLANVRGETLPVPANSGLHNLSNNSKFYGDTHELRMLGYVTDQMQIADRSIYEAALVADYLNKANP